MKTIKALFSFTVCLLGLVVSLAAQTSVAPCKVGKQAPAFGFWTWPANAKIKVYILGQDFKTPEYPFLLTPIKSWNAVSNLTGSGVEFDYAGEVTAPLYCERCLTIMRGQVFDKTRRHATELRTYSAHQDQIMSWAQIVIDPALTNPEALSNALAHELGHTLGLLDCYSCRAQSTVMNQFKELNSTNGMIGPTTCDVIQVKAAFRELAVHVRPAPRSEASLDEGEEPVDDDTPIVVRKP